MLSQSPGQYGPTSHFKAGALEVQGSTRTVLTFYLVYSASKSIFEQGDEFNTDTLRHGLADIAVSLASVTDQEMAPCPEPGENHRADFPGASLSVQ